MKHKVQNYMYKIRYKKSIHVDTDTQVCAT